MKTYPQEIMEVIAWLRGLDADAQAERVIRYCNAVEQLRAAVQQLIVISTGKNLPPEVGAGMDGMVRALAVLATPPPTQPINWPNENGRVIDAAGNALESPLPTQQGSEDEVAGLTRERDEAKSEAVINERHLKDEQRRSGEAHLFFLAILDALNIESIGSVSALRKQALHELLQLRSRLEEYSKDITGVLEECAKHITLSNDFPWSEEVHCVFRNLEQENEITAARLAQVEKERDTARASRDVNLRDCVLAKHDTEREMRLKNQALSWLDKANARLAAYESALPAAVGALEEIATQKTTEEIMADEKALLDDSGVYDYDAAYDRCVKTARVALRNLVQSTSPQPTQEQGRVGPTDTERMDWMEWDCHQLVWDDQSPGVERASDGKRFFGSLLRDAIDAAMHTANREGK